MKTYPPFKEFRKPKRRVNTVFLHYPAMKSREQDSVETVAGWHINENKWDDIGYHFYINGDGHIFCGRDLEKTPAAQKGYNSGTIAICAYGNDASLASLKELCLEIDQTYSGNIKFKGHKEVAATLCPPYDYKKLLNLSPSGLMLKGAATTQKLLESGSRTISGVKSVKDTATGVSIVSVITLLAGFFTWLSDQLPVIKGAISQSLPYLQNAKALRDLLPVLIIIAALLLREKAKQIEKARLDDESKVKRIDD